MRWVRRFRSDGSGGAKSELRSVWRRAGGLVTERFAPFISLGLHAHPVRFAQPQGWEDVHEKEWRAASRDAWENPHTVPLATEVASPSGSNLTVGFAHAPRKLWAAGIPIPPAIGPTALGVTLPHHDGNGWWVDVQVHHPWFGLVVAYRGHVRRADN